MKIYISILLMLIGFNVLPQGFNNAYHSFNDFAFDLTKVGSNVYFSSEVNLGFPDSAYITSVNSSGVLRFKKGIKKNQYTHINQLHSTLDNKICFVGYARPCDYSDNTERTFIMKIDTLGSIKFDNTFSNLYSNNMIDYLIDLVQVQDSSYYCITDSVLFHFNKNGVLIKRKNTGLTMLKTITNYSQNKLLISGKQSGVDKHIIIDTSGNVINSKPSYGSVTKYRKLSSGNIISLQNDFLKKINSGLIAIDSSVVSQGNTGIVDFEINQDTIYTVGTVNPSYNYIKFDSSFTNKYQFSTSAKRIIPQGITVAGNNVTLLSNSTNTVTNSNQFIGLTSFNKTGTFTYDNDIGVISVVVDSTAVTTTTNNPPGYTKYEGAYRLKVIVKNIGNTTVQQFYLNHYLHPEICGKAYYHPLVTLPLAPGGTIAITTPLFSNNILAVNPGPPSNQTFSMSNVCVYTTLPNMKNDLDFSNDASCITVLFPYATRVKENSISETEIKISPNPFNDKVHISGDVEIRKVEVFNLIGQRLKISHIQDFKTELNLNDTSPGVYFIKIVTEKGEIIKKAVKE